MIVVVDGDDDGALCTRLASFGCCVFRPWLPSSTTPDPAFHACLQLAWYLMLARWEKKNKQRDDVVFVSGCPRSLDAVTFNRDALRHAGTPLNDAYEHLLACLSTEFNPAAHVLLQASPNRRSQSLAITNAAARSMNHAYWSMYHALVTSGCRVVVL